MSTEKRLVKEIEKIMMQNSKHMINVVFKDRQLYIPSILNDMGTSFLDVENKDELARYIIRNLDDSGINFLKNLHHQFVLNQWDENQVKEKAIKEIKNGKSNDSTEQ